MGDVPPPLTGISPASSPGTPAIAQAGLRGCDFRINAGGATSVKGQLVWALPPHSTNTEALGLSLAERRRREAIAAATCLTEALTDHLNVGVAQAYVNQRKLDHEVKTLQIQAAQFAKQTGQWINMVENFNQALKEIGDVENWARSIELDMRTIATALEYVYKGQLQPSGS
uniref:Biogenesis of lysosome-related organelles complex 1 subunit 1 n=1 Tax=Chrysemys picta bellii TaxID=8478 RepID=A0A8C3I7Y7_CHRPI